MVEVPTPRKAPARATKKAAAKRTTKPAATTAPKTARKRATTSKAPAQVVQQLPTRLHDLTNARETLLHALAIAEVRELPGIVRELRAVLLELDSLAPKNEGTALDEIAARRNQRKSTANNGKEPAGG